MSTAASSYVALPYYLINDNEDEKNLRIPPDIHTLAGFRRWMHAADFPEKLKAHFIQGAVFIDMSQESIQTHVLVKTAVFQTLPNLMDEEDLGEFYPDGIMLTNKAGPLSNNPDGVAALWETIESGRVKFLVQNKQEVEIQGTPDWIMEIVSRSSVTKDKKLLRKAYHRAGISEYWLIDARGKEIDFQILLWRKAGYVAAPREDGWQFSEVFNRYFRLIRKCNRRDAWHYKLEVKPPEA